MKTRLFGSNTMRTRTVGYGDSVTSAVLGTIRTLQANPANVTTPYNRHLKPGLVPDVVTERLGALSFNGSLIDSGEYLSSSGAAPQHRGTASRETWEGNRDESKHVAAPLFNNFLLWQDHNGAGKQQAAEVSSLTTLGAKSPYYFKGMLIQAGQTNQMSTLSLQAKTVGSIYFPKVDGIQTNTNNGAASTLLVTQAHELNAVQPNADVLTIERAVAAIIQARGSVNADGVRITGLLDNDHVSNALNKKQCNYYKKLSCLRPNLLGYGTKKYFKTAKKCSKRATIRDGNRKEARKRSDLGSKSSQSRLFMGASSYGICSALSYMEL